MSAAWFRIDGKLVIIFFGSCAVRRILLLFGVCVHLLRQAYPCSILHGRGSREQRRRKYVHTNVSVHKLKVVIVHKLKSIGWRMKLKNIWQWMHARFGVVLRCQSAEAKLCARGKGNAVVQDLAQMPHLQRLEVSWLGKV